MRLAFCLEQTLGHRAHSRNIERALAQDRPSVEVINVEYREARAPLPWTVRASLDARAQLRARPANDVTFFHTQTVALFAGQATRGHAYVVSLDATPLQVDGMARWYRHGIGPRPVEAVKHALHQRVLRKAAGVVAWSEWTARSLVEDYGVPAERVHVVHPGAGAEFFRIPPRTESRRPRILFVGGDFERKGGPSLLRAFTALQDRAELCVVTTAAVRVPPGVRVIRNATPGSEELVSAYAEADIFCLPTLGDCTSVAIEEAMAAGCAVITTTVGSNATTVQDGSTGVLIPPGDDVELLHALSFLIEDAGARIDMGVAARQQASECYDAFANAQRLVSIMESVA